MWTTTRGPDPNLPTRQAILGKLAQTHTPDPIRPTTHWSDKVRLVTVFSKLSSVICTVVQSGFRDSVI